MAALEETQLSRIIAETERDFAPYISRMAVRRLFIEGGKNASKSNDLGTNLPPPYDKSMLTILARTGDQVDAVEHYSARIGANPPQPVVPRVTKTNRVARKVDETASSQERWLSATWDAAGGRQKQGQISWSQSWCGVGWYLTMPRDIGFGLPDRSYHEDLTDEQIEKMQSADELSLTPSDDGKYAESADNWIKRRREKAYDDALNALPLFTLEAIPGDMVRHSFDRDGVAYAYVVEEVPASRFAPGSEYCVALAKRLGVDEGDVQKYGVVYAGGKIVAGATVGGEQDSQETAHTFTFIRFFDRECVYYLVAGQGSLSGAKLLWSAYHGAGVCPLVPSPAHRTDSRRSGSEFKSPMESVFAIAAPLNQLLTLLSNVAVLEGTPRWVIEKPDGSLVVDEQGHPREIVGIEAFGLDPSEAQVIEGHLKQVSVSNPDVIVKMLEIYLQQMEKAMPPDVAQGEGGTSGAAWTVRMLQSAAQADLEQPVGNHARAVREIMTIWVRWARLLDVPLYAMSVPHQRGNMRAVQGMIEIDPGDLVQGFEVIQSKDSQADRVVQQQMGIELYTKAQLIDSYEYFETYAGASDPGMATLLMWKERLVQAVMTGAPVAAPGSVLDTLLRAVQGRVFYKMMQDAPNSAILQAQVMAEQAAMQPPTMGPPPGGAPPAGPMDNHALPRGNVAEPAGIRQPGMGAPVSLPGSPLSGMNAAEGRM